MGICWSTDSLILIPVPPDGDEEPLPGYEYVPLEEYIVAIEIKTEKQTNKPDFLLLNQNPWNESIFT